MMSKEQCLTYDDLADFYKEKTGKSARIMRMEDIYDWATMQEEIKINDDTSLSFKQEAK